MPEAVAEATVRWGAVGSLLLTSLALMGSPGPTTISLVGALSAYGMRASLPYFAGLIAGSALVLVAVVTGITAVLLAVPAFGSVLIGLSAAYILWLAYHMATALPLSERAGGSDAPSFAGGALLGVANPKAWVAFSALVAGSTLADSAVADVAAKLALLGAMIVLVHAGWLGAGLSLLPVLRDLRRARVVNAALALTLVGATALAVLE